MSEIGRGDPEPHELRPDPRGPCLLDLRGVTAPAANVVRL